VKSTTYSDWTVSVSPTAVSPAEKFLMEVSVTCPNKMANGYFYGTPTGTPLFKFEIKTSSGVNSGGGDVFKGTQSLSNSNYTVTYTLEIKAPTAEGLYTVQVYSSGAAADYIYCKMQMNGRTNGPKTSLTVESVPSTTSSTSTTTSSTTTTTSTVKPITTTTIQSSSTSALAISTTSSTSSTTTTSTTTTTIPPLPVEPAALNRADTSQPVVLIGGVIATPEIVQDPSSLTLFIGGVVVGVETDSSNGNNLALTVDGRLRLINGNVTNINLGGFKSSSDVQLWIIQESQIDQKYIGSYTTDEDGALVASIEIPSGLGSGNADLVLSGENADGSEVVVGLPVSLEMTSNFGGFTDSLLAGFLFAIGAVFIFLVLRKKRDAEEIEQPIFE